MTSKERFLTAIRNGEPDRVPVVPDVSCMIPAKRTGLPFWDTCLLNNPPIWEAYLETANYFGFDIWFQYGDLQFMTDPVVEWCVERSMDVAKDRMIERRNLKIGSETFFHENTCPRDDPPSPTKKIIDDFAKDWPRLKRHLFPEIVGYDKELFERQRAAVGEQGIFGTFIETPGVSEWFHLMAGGLEAVVYALMDHPDLIEELCEMHHRHAMRRLEMVCDVAPDFVLLGSSGSLTMASPELYRRWSLPTLQAQTKLLKEAGIASMLHSCGKEYELVKMCAEETDLDCINPLEIAPMGDCDLARLKHEFGSRLSLMGNLHTTDIMLRGSVQDVEEASRRAIDDAASGGGFILSTGDQCGRDTPEENIFAMIRVAQEYGQYT